MHTLDRDFWLRLKKMTTMTMTTLMTTQIC